MSNMYRFVTIGAAVLAAAAVPSAAIAAPSSTTKVPLVNDCGNAAINGACQSLDMIGTFAGVVKYRHKGNGDLRLMIQVKAAPPDQSYKLAVYCGQTAARPGTLIGELADAVKTDTLGAGAGGPFQVPMADIRTACGTGNAIGHVQLVNTQAGSILDAAPIKLSAG